jgi:hypothetical protein
MAPASGANRIDPPFNPGPEFPMKPRTKSRLLTASLFLCTLTLAKAEDVVKWPNLKKLDDIAERCEALSDKKDIPGLRKVAAEAKSAAVLVEKDKIPGNAKDKERVKTLQSDLKSLTDALGDPATGDGDELLGLLAGIHPIVEQLMEASGMPHVHEAEPKKNFSDS